MTQFATTYTRFDAIGVAEEVEDEIYNISPYDTPFMTNAGRGRVDNTLFEWQTDALAAASTSNQQIEGDDITSITAATPTVRIGNYVEIARKLVAVSGTLEATKRYGRGSELGYQMALKSKELKRDMESSMLANKAANAGTTAVARKTGSFLVFLKTNISKDAGGTAPVYTTAPTDVWTDGSTRAFTETIVKSVLQQCYTSGAEPKTIMVGASNKQTASTFAGVVELNSPQSKSGQATIIGAADTYIGDFGKLSVVPNRFQRTSTAFFIDWDYVKVNYLRPLQTFALAKTGDAEKREILAEYGVAVGNEKAHGVAVDLA